MGGYMFVATFCPLNIECNRGLSSMIFYDELVILECDSRHSFSCYFFRYPMRPQTTISYHNFKQHVKIRLGSKVIVFRNWRYLALARVRSPSDMTSCIFFQTFSPLILNTLPFSVWFLCNFRCVFLSGFSIENFWSKLVIALIFELSQRALYFSPKFEHFTIARFRFNLHCVFLLQLSIVHFCLKIVVAPHFRLGCQIALYLCLIWNTLP